MVIYEEALRQSTEYFQNNEMAANVFVGKYALKDPKTGEVLEPTPREMHHRLAKEFARMEQKYPNPLSEDEIFHYFDNFGYIIPQGSPMAAIGNKHQLMSISNCFVIQAPYDSMSGIGYTMIEEQEIMKRRGGVGFDISTLRPRGMNTSNAAGTTDGISVFMEKYSNACRETAQNGRRGALMLTISVHHPEIRTFIHIKDDLEKVTGANISIRLSDEFMNAVKDKTEVQLRFPVDSTSPTISEMVDADEIWTEICAAAHKSAEPGLLFWDSVMKYCPANCYPDYTTVSTNPCGEITLSPYDSCRLLLVNVLSFVDDPFTAKAKFNWKKFAKVVRVAQRLMDDVVDLELEAIDKILAKIATDPEPEHTKFIEKNLWTKIRIACENGRRTGLGVTAIGDTVAALNERYGSEDSLRTVEHIYRELCLNSYRESVNLASERGAFPAFDARLEEGDAFLQRVWNADPDLCVEYKKYGRRNIANLTTPPAGSSSIIAKSVNGFGTSSGIENVPYITYTRRKKENPSDKNFRCDFTDNSGDRWQEFKVYHQGYEAWKDITDSTDKDIEKSPYWKSTVDDVDWVAKVQMQGLAQKWVDHSISSTTNLPEDVTVEMVKGIYLAGWESGCKGLTIYRKNSRAGVIIESSESNKSDDSEEIIFRENHAPKRSKELLCDIYHSTVQGEKWTIFVSKMENRPYEIMGGLAKYVNIPRRVKSGKVVKHNGEINPARYDLHYDFSGDPEDETVIKDLGNVFENPIHSAFTRTLSLSLRHGVPVQFIVEQLNKGSEKDSDLFSFSKVTARVLKSYIKDGTSTSQKKCTECGSDQLSYQSGCTLCLSCGYSKCG